MNVADGASTNDPASKAAHLAQIAEAMGFLADALRARGVTLQSLASAHGTHRSNLSAFIRSRGTTRNISEERVRGVCTALGVHWDFVLCARLHRWNLGSSVSEHIAGLERILKANAIRAIRALRTLREVYVVVELVGRSALLIRAEHGVEGHVLAACGRRSVPIEEADQRTSNAVQTAWMGTETEGAHAMQCVVSLLVCGSEQE